MSSMERVRIKDIAIMAGVSVGTVDRVIHGRSGVSKESRIRVEKILKQLNYQPNMYASALASNKRYRFACLLPLHENGEYWSDVERGIMQGTQAYTDFYVGHTLSFYDPYDYHSFTDAANRILEEDPDGVLFAPTRTEFTAPFVMQLNERNIPYIYIDSNVREYPALAFYGQNSYQSGIFAGRMMMLAAGKEADEVVIFRKINDGIVGSNQQERREIGFRSFMAEQHPHCKIWELDLHAKHNNEDFSMLEAFFQAHPHVKNGITFNSKAFIVGEYLEAKGISDFKLTGYDLLSRNVSCLKRGSIFFLIAQQPSLQGFNGVKALADHLIFKKEVIPENFMPIDLLTKENIDYYYNL